MIEGTPARTERASFGSKLEIGEMRAILFGGVLGALTLSALLASAHEPAPKALVAAGALSPPAAEAALVIDAFHAALAKGKAQDALELLADDALIFEEGGAERSKAEYAAHHLAADAAFSQAVPATMTRRSGAALGETAWIASEGRTTGRFKDKAVDRLTTETIVLRKVGSDWRIAHIHWSSQAAKP